jgi:hypothetical protein
MISRLALFAGLGALAVAVGCGGGASDGSTGAGGGAVGGERAGAVGGSGAGGAARAAGGAAGAGTGSGGVAGRASGAGGAPGSGGAGGVNGSGGAAAGGAAGATAAGGASGTGGRGGAGGAAGAGGPDVCGTGAENANVTLTCPSGQTIATVVFASFGTPSGTCGAFTAGACDATTSTAVVEALCVGRASCTIPATNGSFGDPCHNTVKSFAVEVTCAPAGAGTGGAGGGQLPFKGVANSPCSARQALNVSWYYNWEQTETEPCSGGGGGQFVPMIWGHTGNEQSASGISASVASFVSKGYGYVLGFNEPDNSSQSNIPVATAISLWPSFDNPAIKAVSPATAANANPGQAWFTSFMNQLNASSSLRADVLALHWYGWNAGSCDASASQLESYIKWAEGFSGNRPIWLTEWGCLNNSAPDVATVVSFYNGALAVFARHPRVERYAWYPWSTNLALVNSDGSLTPLGAAYAAAPAYK